MIEKVFYMTRNDGVNLFLTRSTESLKIHKIGTEEIYDEAIDVEGAPYTYEETDIPVEDSVLDNGISLIEEKAAAYDILMGVSE